MEKFRNYKHLYALIALLVLFSCTEDTSTDGAIQEDPIIIPPPINPLPDPTFGLSKTYDEYYSGYWKGSICGGNEEAIIGISGSTAELDTRASYMLPAIGSIDSSGNLSFLPREVNWDCDTCGVVRPLEISGSINSQLMSGTIEFEVACANSSRSSHTVSTVYVALKSGAIQPSPYNELYRIKSEAVDLINSNVQGCNQLSECKAFNIDPSNIECNFNASAYSTTVVDEGILSDLQNEYSRNKWLSTSYISSSSTTLCAYYLNAECEQNTCVMK